MAVNPFYSQTMREFMRIIVPQLPKDVAFVCDDGNGRMGASMAVLAVNSETFAKLWKTYSGVNPLVVLVPEVSSAEINCLLNFVYFGSIEGANHENLRYENLINLAKRLKVVGFIETFDEFRKLHRNDDQHNGIIVEQDKQKESKELKVEETEIEVKSVGELATELGIEISEKNLIINDFNTLSGIMEDLDFNMVEMALVKHANKPLSVIRRREVKLKSCRFSDSDLTPQQKDLLQVLDNSIYEVSASDSPKFFTMECQINSNALTATADSKIRAVNVVILLALKFILDKVPEFPKKTPLLSEPLLDRLRKIFDSMESHRSKDVRKWGRLKLKKGEASRYDLYEGVLTPEEKSSLKELDKNIVSISESAGRKSFEMSLELDSTTKVSGDGNTKLKAANNAVLAAIKSIKTVPHLKFHWPALSKETPVEEVPLENLVDRLKRIFNSMESQKSKNDRKWRKLNIPARYDDFKELLTPEEKEGLNKLDSMIKLQGITGKHGRDTFEMSIELDSAIKVSGVAKTKLKAANLAVLAALQSIKTVPALRGKWPALSRTNLVEKKIFDVHKFDSVLEKRAAKKKKKSKTPQINPDWKIRLRKYLDTLESRGRTFKSESPFEILKTVIPEAMIDFSSKDGKDGTVNRCLIKINGQEFETTERTKMKTKHEVSKMILRKFFNLEFDPPVSVQVATLHEISQNFGNLIENLVLAKYNELLANAKDVTSYMSYKALAGVVVTFDEDLETAKVISIGTGSKFLHATHIKTNGEALIDSHAEVVARRGLLVFLYNELISGSTDIFESKEHEKYCLKPGIKFHFYASTAPCGDGRIFSHAAEPIKSKKLGFLRTKGECLRTTKVVDYDQLLLQKKEIHIMSCSDKLMKWNILGVQGALLAQFIERIRFSTISIGAKMQVENIKRAVMDRITIENIPELHIPEFHSVINSQAQQTANSNLYSINWNIATNQLEAVNATTGLMLSTQKTTTKSQLSKRSMLGFFTKLRAAQNCHFDGPIRYVAAKLDSKEYNEDRDKFMELMSEANLGVWLKKTSALEDFKLKIVDRSEIKKELCMPNEE